MASTIDLKMVQLHETKNCANQIWTRAALTKWGLVALEINSARHQTWPIGKPYGGSRCEKQHLPKKGVTIAKSGQ